MFGMLLTNVGLQDYNIRSSGIGVPFSPLGLEELDTKKTVKCLPQLNFINDQERKNRKLVGSLLQHYKHGDWQN